MGEIKNQFSVNKHSEKIDEIIAIICKNENMAVKETKSGGRRREASRIRAQIAIGLVKTHGVSLAEVGRQLGVTTSAVSRIITRAGSAVNWVNNIPNWFYE